MLDTEWVSTVYQFCSTKTLRVHMFCDTIVHGAVIIAAAAQNER